MLRLESCSSRIDVFGDETVTLSMLDLFSVRAFSRCFRKRHNLRGNRFYSVFCPVLLEAWILWCKRKRDVVRCLKCCDGSDTYNFSSMYSSRRHSWVGKITFQ